MRSRLALECAPTKTNETMKGMKSMKDKRLLGDRMSAAQTYFTVKMTSRCVMRDSANASTRNR